MYFSNFLLVLSVISVFNIQYVLSCKGCVNLDEYNFNKIIQKFPVVLVKFDVAYPYGEIHEIFSQLSQEISPIKDLLFADVGVKDYGEKDNENLVKRFGITKDDYPVIKLFRGDPDKPISYPPKTDVSIDNLRTFLRDNTNIYIGMPGCLEKFDKLANEFINSADKEKQLKIAESEAEKLQKDEEKHSVKIYLTIMKKVKESGSSFVKQESDRVSKLLQGKLSDKKKTELQSKLNIIRAFQVSNKDEL